MAIIKEFRFYVLVAVLAALECSLILAGILEPMSHYSIGQVVLSLASLVTVAYMGWTLSKTGMKKVAVKGAVAGVISITITLSSAAIGIMVGTPVLGIEIPPSYLLPAFISIAVTNIILFMVSAVIGAFLAKKLQKNTKK